MLYNYVTLSPTNIITWHNVHCLWYFLLNLGALPTIACFSTAHQHCKYEEYISFLQRLYREKGETMKHNYTLSGELPEMVQARLNAVNISEVKPHREHTIIHQTANKSIHPFSCLCVRSSMWYWVYTSVLFQSCYKESWTKIRDGGYKLSLDAIPFQSAKASADILSDVSLKLCVI